MVLFNVLMAILYPLAPVAQLIEDVRRDDDDSVSTIPTFSDDDDSAPTISAFFRARIRFRRFYENRADFF